MKQAFGWIGALVVLLVSFIILAPPYASGIFYNSDQAIHVLMAYEPHLPEGLFYWGQQRLGSLIPLLAHPLTAFIAPVWAVTLIQYGALLIAWFLLAKRLPNTLAQIILAIAIFLPPFDFVESVLLGHPYAAQLLLLALALELFSRGKTNTNKGLLLASGFVAGLGIWVSELQVIVLLGTGAYYLAQQSTYQPQAGGFNWSLQLSKNYKPVYLGFALALGWFILCKFLVTGGQPYDQTINETLWGDLTKVFGRIYDNLVFATGLVWNSVFTWVAIFGLVFTTTQLRKHWQNTFGTWLMLAGYAGIIFCLFSKWVALNDMAPRYFSLSYLLIIFGALQNSRYWAPIANYSVWATVLFGAVSLLGHPEALKPSRFSQMAGVADLGNVILSGEYKTVYLHASVAPDKLIPLVFEGGQNRTPWIVDSIATRKPLYFMEAVGDNASHLDTLEDMYSFTFSKQGPTKQLNPIVYAAPYKLTLLDRNFLPTDLGHQTGQMVTDTSAISKQAWLSDANADQNPSFALFGPYLPLPKGTYKATFFLKAQPDASKDEYFIIDIVGNGGQDVWAKQDVTPQQVAGNHYASVILPFEITNPTGSTVEFRMFTKTKTQIAFSHLRLERILAKP